MILWHTFRLWLAWRRFNRALDREWARLTVEERAELMGEYEAAA